MRPHITVPPTEIPRARLDFLDGMRGLAALYVVLHHAAFEVPALFLKPFLAHVSSFFDHGHYAVAVFIVLSGYCLMLPVARDAEGRLRGGLWQYIKRRARRILPPYYAAMGLSLAMIALIPALGSPSHSRWDVAIPAFTPGAILSHLFLVHDVTPTWLFRIDPPMWSVAFEWHIYFLFPLLLIVWRRLGIVAAVGAGFVLSFWPEVLLAI